jgi:hypothetical protein
VPSGAGWMLSMTQSGAIIRLFALEGVEGVGASLAG